MAEFELLIFLLVFLSWVVRSIFSLVKRAREPEATPHEESAGGKAFSTKELLEELSKAAGMDAEEVREAEWGRQQEAPTARSASAPTSSPPAIPSPPPIPRPVSARSATQEQVRRSAARPTPPPPPSPPVRSRPAASSMASAAQGLGAVGPLIQEDDAGQIAAMPSSSRVESASPWRRARSKPYASRGSAARKRAGKSRSVVEAVRRDLQTGPNGVARAVLLAEILSPPPGLAAFRKSRRPGDP
ncbi:MAG: hypothetical protein AAGD01_19025 [Acidobacteriota bacterium]